MIRDTGLDYFECDLEPSIDIAQVRLPSERWQGASLLISAAALLEREWLGERCVRIWRTVFARFGQRGVCGYVVLHRVRGSRLEQASSAHRVKKGLRYLLDQGIAPEDKVSPIWDCGRAILQYLCFAVGTFNAAATLATLRL